MKNYFLALGACILLVSCSTGDAAMSRMMGGSSQALTFLNCQASALDELEFVFSQPVTITSINLEPEIPIDSVENGSTIRIKLAENPQPGVLITADLVAEDERRNSINVLVTLRAKNDRMPELVINELFTEYASKDEKTEYIELKMLTAGNLGAMRVFIIGNSTAARETIYEFSPVEVNSGEYVVIHLRTLNETSRNEYGTNLAESGGRYASASARDFWIPGTTAKLFHKTAMVYVVNQEDRILDAVMISENPDSSWPREHFTETENLLLEKNAWNGIAASSAGITATKSISRDETAANTNSAADWYVTATSGMTPGGRNNPKR